MHPQEILERYRQGERDFSHRDFSGANLSGFNLRGANLTGTNLTEANLSWAFLNQATLTEACLRRADLRSASLNGATLNQSILSGANLSKIDLRLANLQNADLNWAVMQEADLASANLTSAKLDQVNLDRAKLNSANLAGAELMEATLRRANLSNANLDRANLREAHLEEANLREASLKGANLTEANLSGAYLRQANLSEADLHRVVLAGADLSEAILTSADLSRANLAGSYLLKASLQGAHLLRANLQDAYLLRTDLSEANLRGADLQRADLSGAYLSNTSLSEANLTDAYLLESHLIHTTFDGAILTGCCIYNWHPESVDFSKVQCRYLYTQFNHTEKKPTDRVPEGRDFEPGEMGTYYQDDHTGVDLYFTESVNWEVLAFTLVQVAAEEPGLILKVKFYELAEDNYWVKLSANRTVNSKVLARRVFQLYPEVQQRLAVHRPKILSLLGIASANIEETATSTAERSPQAPSDRRAHLYQEVVRQIQYILVTQTPDQLVDSVQRLLNYLQQEGIATKEIQRKVISQAVAQRAKRDEAFREHLLKWSAQSPNAVRSSPVGQALRVAIALFSNPQSPKT